METDMESKKNAILRFKAEVYDIIRQQELLILQNNQLQEKKLLLVQEIQKLEKLEDSLVQKLECNTIS